MYKVQIKTMLMNSKEVDVSMNEDEKIVTSAFNLMYNLIGKAMFAQCNWYSSAVCAEGCQTEEDL